jgi:hypothetical protein
MAPCEAAHLAVTGYRVSSDWYILRGVIDRGVLYLNGVPGEAGIKEPCPALADAILKISTILSITNPSSYTCV